jgi:predicted outer membrane repeat protein
MKITRHLFVPALLAGGLMLAASARAADFHVTTAQDLQNALTAAAGNGADNTIWMTNGYYTGTFSYNSSATYSLTVWPEPGSTNVAIDGAAGGRGLNITCSGASGNVTVSNLTFIRNCGNYQIGALRIAASGGGTAIVDGCRFLSATNSRGMGVEIASGLNTIIRNCIIIGKTNGVGSLYDGDGINISGVTGNTLLCNSTIAGNWVGDGADITASAVLTVTNNVFQTNYYYGLYFNPSSGTKTAVVGVSNNVFSLNGQNGGYTGVYLNNFGALNLSANIFNGNYGGGFLAYSGNSAAIAGNTFYGNGYYQGYNGGIALWYVPMTTVTGNNFNGNSGGGNGGGGALIYQNAISTNIVTGNTFNGNSSYSGNGGGAAFIYAYSGASISIISNNTFGANTVYGPGGAVAVSGNGTITLAGNSFTGNSCSGNFSGGAVFISGGTNLVTGNFFTQNSAANGGGAISVSCPVITLSDNLIVYNSQSSAGASGGGIFVNPQATLYMINNTVFGNSSGGGGGGSSFQVNGSVELLNVFNNIIWGNTANGNGSDVYLTGSGLMKLFMFNDANGMYGVWNNALPQLNVDPKFFNPANTIYGDYHLQAGSPCLNYGTNGLFLPAIDLDGNVRTNNAGQVDLGCYEFNNTAKHPADTNANFVISAAEYSAYAAAWKAGQTWTNGGPNPISADYVTRAGYLMTNNSGVYHNDGSARPLNWKTGP